MSFPVPHKPGFLKQWLDLQAKLIDLIPYDVNITEPKLDAVVENRIFASDGRTVHKYFVIVTLRTNPNVYAKVEFSVNDLAAQMPAVWENYNTLKAQDAAEDLRAELLERIQ